MIHSLTLTCRVDEEVESQLVKKIWKWNGTVRLSRYYSRFEMKMIPASAKLDVKSIKTRNQIHPVEKYRKTASENGVAMRNVVYVHRLLIQLSPADAGGRARGGRGGRGGEELIENGANHVEMASANIHRSTMTIICSPLASGSFSYFHDPTPSLFGFLLWLRIAN